MAKLYWAWTKDSDEWFGPHETIEACKADARESYLDLDGEIWVAPVDAELDDDDAFWDALADHLLVWGIESAEESLVEDGWIDPEEAWHSGSMTQDRDRTVAKALREVLGPRPAWRTVDTAKAKKVEL